MSTHRDLIRISAALVGVTNPSPRDYADALTLEQRMLDGMNADVLLVGTRVRLTVTWTANQGTRTLASTGADLAVARPLWIDAWSAIPVGATTEAFDAKKPLTRQEYNEITTKAQTASYFSELAYEPTFPLGTATVWPVPTTAPTLVLYVPEAMSALSVALADPLSYRPGVEEHIQYELAMRLAGLFRQAWSRENEMLRRGAAMRVKAANVRVESRRNDPTLVGRGVFDIESGSFRR